MPKPFSPGSRTSACAAKWCIPPSIIHRHYLVLTIGTDDFEVSIFLTETDTRHSLLHKQKYFRDKVQTKLTSNSSKLTGGASRDAPIDVDNADDNFVLQEAVAADDVDIVPIIREEEDEDAIDLAAIPAIHETVPDSAAANRRPKRRRHTSEQGQDADHASEGAPDIQAIDTDSSDDDHQLEDNSDEEDDYDSAVNGPPPPKRRKEKAAARDTEARDDKKKMAMDISYEGFAIYGRVLCLVVKRRERGKGGSSAAMKSIGSGKSQPDRLGGQAMMENWITSTQLPAGDDDSMDAS